MITSYKYEGKNNEELLIDALTELKVTRDDVYFKQTTSYSEYLTLNVPNLYTIMPGDTYIAIVGIVLLL